MTETSDTVTAIPRLMLTPAEAASVIGVSRTRIFALMGSGAIESVRVGRSRRVPVSALEEFVARLRAETAQPASRIE